MLNAASLSDEISEDAPCDQMLANVCNTSSTVILTQVTRGGAMTDGARTVPNEASQFCVVNR